MSRKTSQSLFLTALLLLAVASEVVWSYASMHLGSFAAPHSAGAMPTAATVAFYGGYLAVAAAMVVRPRLFGPMIPPASSCTLAAIAMAASSVLWSFAYGQTLFNPEAVLLAGALLSGLAGAFAIAVVYPAAFTLLNPAPATVVVIAAHLCKRLAAPAIDALGMGINALLLTYALPIVMAASLWLAVRLKSHTPAHAAKPRETPASLWLLLVTTGLALTVGDKGGTGVWSLAATSIEQGPLELATVAVLVLAGIIGLRPLARAPLQTRFLPVLLVAALPTLLADVAGFASACLTDASQTFFHGAAWAITFACARECRVDVRRAAGVVFIAQAASTLAMGILTGSSVAPGPFVALSVATALLATAVPLMGSAADRAPDAPVLPEVASSDLRASLNARCQEVAQAHGLSGREADVLRLLVEGWPRQDICEALGISEGTVKTHASHIYAKLEIQSRQDLAGVVFGRQE